MNYESRTPSMTKWPSRSSFSLGFLALCLLAAALNLRPALTSLATVLTEVQQALEISSFSAGILTTIPVLCFGVFGPLAPLLSSRLGLERALFLLLLLLGVALGLRMYPHAVTIAISTLGAGASIGMAGVLLPVVIRGDFPNQIGVMTGIYTMALSVGGASAAGLTPLFERTAGAWTSALAIWSIPALIAASLWSALALNRTMTSRMARLPPFSNLLRDPVAWYVTAFMGLQAALAFIVLGWLPTLLRDRGFDVINAGLVTSSSIMAQTITALLVPPLATKLLSPRIAIMIVLMGACAGFLGLIYAPIESWPLWSVVLGLGQGGLFGLALLFISLRSPSAEVAAMVSGMSQSIGYLGAALGPLATSLLRDAFSGPTGPALLFTVISVFCTWFGLRAAQPVYILSPGTR